MQHFLVINLLTCFYANVMLMIPIQVELRVLTTCITSYFFHTRLEYVIIRTHVELVFKCEQQKQ